MTLQKFYTYQENSFDKLARIMIIREGINARKEISRREARETPISQLNEWIPELTVEDEHDLDRVKFFIGDL